MEQERFRLNIRRNRESSKAVEQLAQGTCALSSLGGFQHPYEQITWLHLVCVARFGIGGWTYRGVFCEKLLETSTCPKESMPAGSKTGPLLTDSV